MNLQQKTNKNKHYIMKSNRNLKDQKQTLSSTIIDSTSYNSTSIENYKQLSIQTKMRQTNEDLPL